MLHITYQTIFTYLYGASLGKMVCKIIILDEDLLDKPNLNQSCIRSIVRQISDMAFMLGFAWALSNDLRKTWEDYLARTIVVNVACNLFLSASLTLLNATQVDIYALDAKNKGIYSLQTMM